MIRLSPSTSSSSPTHHTTLSPSNKYHSAPTSPLSPKSNSRSNNNASTSPKLSAAVSRSRSSKKYTFKPANTSATSPLKYRIPTAKSSDSLAETHEIYDALSNFSNNNKSSNSLFIIRSDGHLESYQRTSPTGKLNSSPTNSAAKYKKGAAEDSVKHRETGFVTSGNEHIQIPEYNSLFDHNLKSHFTSKVHRRHLYQAGLVDKDSGRILDMSKSGHIERVIEREFEDLYKEKRKLSNMLDTSR